MLTRKAFSLLLIAALLYGIIPYSLASAATFSYTGDLATAFPNPERGYHNRYEIIDDPSVNDYASSATSIAGFNPDMLDRTFARAKADGDTLIHSYIHLDKYKDTDQLPQALLDNLASGLAAVRAAGLKIILRPAYAWSDSPAVPESRILGHIRQLDAVISANADVVNHLEAGYIGPWGEWHTSQYTDPFSRTDADTRYRIIQTILSTTPASIPVVIRYPIFIKEATELPTPSGSAPLTQQDKDRIGFHNDCFLADSADMGTYDNNSWMGWYYVEEKKQWMYDMATASGGNKMVGGETCDAAGSDDAAGVNVQTEMSKLHFTEINEDYAPVNLNIWKAANLPASGNDPAETAFTRLKRKLGYRFRLVDADFPTSASPGAGFAFSAHLNNDGYAGMIKPRPVFLVFDNGTQRYDVPLPGLDPRLWTSGAVNVPAQTVTLPANMTAGTYKLALWLPDNDPGLRSRPEYSVRLANTGTWDAAKGYNVLAAAVTIGAPTIPAAPAGLTATAGNSQAALAWSASSGAATYSVFRSTTSGSGYAAVASGIAGTSYTDTGLTNGTTYYYVVKAVNSAGTSGNSNEASVTPSNIVPPPAAPTGLTATAGNAQVSLTWTASADATSYRVLRSTTSGSGYAVLSGNVSGTSYTDTGLTNGTTYYYVVQAVNSGGTGGNSVQASATPAAPAAAVTIDSFPSQANFSAKVNDLNQTIGWSMDSVYYGSDTAGNLVMNSGASGQYLQENINQSLAGLQNLIVRARDWNDSDTEQHWNVVLNDGTDHTVGPLSAYGNVTGSYTDLSIPLSAFGANLANTKYIRIVHRDSTYAVLLIDAIKTDGASSGGGGGDTQAPTVPSGVTAASKSQTSVTLAWNASTDNVGVTGYEVYRNGSKVGSPTIASYTDSGLSPGTAYAYTIDAKDAAGNISALSSPLSVTTDSPPALDTQAPTAPTNLSATGHTSGSVSLAWTASTDNVGVTGYEVYRNGTKAGSATGTSFTDSGLAASTSYTYTVKALDAAGNASASSNSVSAATDAAGAGTAASYEAEAAGNALAGGAAVAACPGCSGGFKVGYVGNNSGTLTFNGVLASAAGSYTLTIAYLNGDASRPVSVSVNGGTALNLTLPGTGGWDQVGTQTATVALQSGSNTIKLFIAGGWSPDFDRILVSPPGSSIDLQAPTAPSGVSAASRTTTSVSLSWTASTDNVGVTAYDVYRNGMLAGSSATASFTDTGLSPNTSYSYTVKARDAAGNASAASSALQAATLDAPDTQAPSAPSNVNGTASGTWINLSWTASTDNRGVAGYEIYRGSALAGTSTGTGFLDTGLTPNTSYTYTVKAKDASGNVSAASAPATITTLASGQAEDPPTVPGGLPSNPYPAQSPDGSLTVHALAKGTDPVTNPLKGFAIWFYPGDHADKTATQYGGINNSVEWRYFGLGELMTGMNTYNWEPMEAALDEVASHGKQLALRVASCQSFSSKDYPDFLSGEIRNGCILNYDSPTVMQAFQNFISAFGAKYDGDPRIAFITMGLVGYWGEWHTWPNDGSNGTENWMISDSGANVLMDAYNTAFRKTPVENRYPRSGGGTHLASLSRIGYHDDSFAYKENDPNLGRVGSMTLPLSMGGKTDAQLTQAVLFGAENKWITGSFGGEVRPEVQGSLFGPATATKDDAMTDIEMTHASWMICQNCTYNKNDPNEVAAWQKMGYNFYAKNAYFDNTASGSFKVGVQIENTGVAPFYYGPDMYPVELALKDGSGNVVKTWTTNWDLRTIMPKQIRAFPDWNVPGNPVYVDFGAPQYFDTTISAAGVTPGSYQLVMHIYNPLWKIKEADVRAKGHMPSYLPWNDPLPILFANQSQGADGWLGLGSIAIQ
ncbi:DUF4832 domain-containing protein [Cohnella zeiphila]|uniref:DUF4832 domain-containing protein n=1 Tax=Cohnella zeiphila TaxID=2761120 RepID=A0A7X0SR80_9BACL|nr:DUF4832 domain-containing protein [Cohnella zeiphila]MBB6734675.1 DUF4832 domain-containing protein [Cohnella zeiphila]